MTVVSLCPDPQVLQRLLLGQIPTAEAAPLGEHLLHCEQCAGTLHSLKAEDTLVEALRAGAAAGTDTESGVIEDLIHRLEKLRSSFGPAESSATLPPAVPTATEAAHTARPTPTLLPSPEGTVSLPTPFRTSAPEEATEVGYDFLATAQGPNELGRLGAYRVLKVLGAGGMGVVFQAEDTHLERMVALKVMLPAIASNPSARRRFLLEAKAAASIEHDHIVPIFHVGEDRGTPFLAMPLLKGESLDDRLKREGKLPAAVALRIGREIAEGLAAAHERGLIHRDIKPGNIWLEGGRARVRILDFGLVRAAADTTHATKSGAIVGTPAYMAPEQTRGGSVDPRADLFSLGCVLYRMATGELPFKGADTMSILASLALDNPLPPHERDANIPAALSDLVMQLLAKKPEDRPQTAQVVVERIRAIEQGQAEKTEVWKPTTPAQAAIRPVESTAPAATGRPRAVSSGRGWVPVAVVVALGSLGVAGYLFGPAVYRIATNQGQLVIETDDPDIEVTVKQGGEQVKILDAKTQREVNLKAGSYQLELTAGKDGLSLSTNQFTLERNGRQIVKVRLDAAVADKPPVSEVVGEVRRFDGHTGPVKSVALSPDGRRALSGSGFPEGDKTMRLWDVATGKELRRMEGHAGQVLAVAFSPDDRQALAGNEDGTVLLWDLESGKELRRFGPHAEAILSVAFSPDGLRAIAGGSDKALSVWDLESGKELSRIKSRASVLSVALSPDGRTALSGNWDKTVSLWDLASGLEVRKFEGHGDQVESVAFSPDGRRVLSGSQDKTMRLWDVDTGKEIRRFRGHLWTVTSVAFSPDGRRALSGSQDKTVRLWDVDTGKELCRFSGGAEIVWSVAYSADGRFGLSGGGGLLQGDKWDPGRDFALRLWRLPEPDKAQPPVEVKPPAEPSPLIEKAGEIRRFVGHTDLIRSVVFSSDGRYLLSGSGGEYKEGKWLPGSDNTLRLWDVQTGMELRKFDGHTGWVSSVAFSADGRRALSGSWDRTVRLWDVENGKELRKFEGHTDQVNSVAFSPDGKRALSGGLDHTMRLWDVETGKELRKFEGHTEWIHSVAYSPDGKRVLSGSGGLFSNGKWVQGADQTVRLWDVETGQELKRLDGHTDWVNAVAFLPDGRRVLSGSLDRSLRLWDLETGKELRRFVGHTAGVFAVAVSPDGRCALSGAEDQTARLWDLESGKELQRLEGQTGIVTSVAFSLNGRFVASAGTDKIIRLWGPSGASPPPMAKVGEGRPFAGHTEAVNGVAFSADGRRAVSSSRDGMVRLWDVDTGKEVRQFESGPAVSATISADGHRVLAGTLDLHSFGGAILWDADSGKEIQRFPMGRSWPRSVALSADGRRALMTGLWNTFVLWDVETGKQVHSFTSPGQIVTSVALSPDGRQALSGSDHETFFRLWDVEKGTVERIFKGHDAAIKSVAFAPDGRRALSGNEDGTLRLWDVSNGQELRQYKGHTDSVNSVGFTADGLRAVSGGSDGTVRLWDMSTGKELHCFTGHTGAVLSVAVAPDGRRALSGGEDKSIRLWELPPAGQVRQFDGNTEPIWMVGFGQDGRRVLSVSRDTVRQWDAETGKPADAPWELAKYPTLAVVSPEGRHIVFSYGTQSVYLWEMEPRKPPSSQIFARGAYLTAVAFSGDGKRMIGGNHPLETEPAAVQVWDVSTGKLVRALEGHKQSVRTVALSQDGRLGLSSGPDGVRLWDVDKGEARHSLDRPAVGALAFSPDGRRALLGDESGAVILWDLETGKEASSFTGHKGRVNSVAFSADGLRALSGGDDQTVRLWDATTGKELACFREHTARVSSVAFSPDGRSVLSGSDDKTVRLWALPETPPAQTGEGTLPAPKPAPAAITPEPLPVLPPGAPLNPSALVARPAEIKGVRSWTIEPRGQRAQVNTVAYSPDGRSLVSSSADGAIRLWDVATGRLVHVFVSPSGLTSLAWSAGGTTLAGGCWDQAVRVWDAGSGRLLRTLHSGTETNIQSVAWSPDGKVLASAGGDCTVRLWDVASGRVVYTLKTAQSFAGVYSLAWSPDGKVLAAGSDDNLIRLWDPGSGKLLDVLEGHEGFVHALAWAPDGKILASGSYDHTLRLWEAGSGRVLRVLEGHRDAVYAVTWSPDGKTLASGSADNTVRLWEAGSGRKLGILEGHGHIVA